MEGSIKELSKYRYETGVENLEDARIMFENGRYKKGRSALQIADEVEEDEARVQAIVDIAEKYAPDYDVEKIVRELL